LLVAIKKPIRRVRLVMKNQTTVAVVSEVGPVAAPAAKIGSINIPDQHIRRKCTLVRHGQGVTIVGEEGDRYIVSGEGIRGTVPVRKQYVRVLNA
jgi:hypothetical protein